MIEPLPIPHKCSVLDYCILDDEYKLLFCIFCHKIIGYERNGIRLIKREVVEQHTTYKQNEFSKDILSDSI